MTLFDVRAQFGNPTGLTGRLVGHLMAFKNEARSQTILSLLEIRPADHVLEIGFGPGVDIRRISQLAAHVAGVDHSSEMLRQACRRNAASLGAGRVDLRLGSAMALPFYSAGFDKVVSINCVQFWTDLKLGLSEVHRVLRPGGLAGIAIQPRNKGASARTALEWSARLEDAMRQAGFTAVGSRRLETRPIPTACVLGTR